MAERPGHAAATLALALGLTAGMSHGAAAQTPVPGAVSPSPFGFSTAPDGGAPALIDADAMVYDKDRDVVTATGNVTVVQGARALAADRIEYFIGADRVVATGSVTVLEPGGEVISADRAELTDGMKRAVASELGLRLSDGSRLVGRTVDRIAGDRTILTDAAFTPCTLCADKPEEAPIWRLRARKVEHDEVAHDINYEDVTLDIAGVPVMYLPYFSHPDPTVDRRTGFLSPTLFFGGEFDAIAQIPYYWSIAPNIDLTFKPFVTAESLPVAALEYRHLFESGAIRFDGSIGQLDRTSNSGDRVEDTTRGHAFLDGQFALDDTWRATLVGRLASDDSYLETFHIDDADVLRNQAFVEGFWDDSYARIGGFGVQDLRESTSQNDTPYALPELFAAYRGAAGPYGNAFGQTDARVLGRNRGADGESVSATVGWELPITTAGGHLFDFQASLRGDFYDTRDGQAIGAANDGTATRAVPRAVAGWRYPLLQENSWGALILEPRAQAVLSLDNIRSNDIPNEDSRAIEFDDSNIFSPDRFPGRDLVDDGQRIDYGLSATGLFADGGRVRGFIGQSMARKPGAFAAAAGMTGHWSDVAAAAAFSPAPWLDLSWRMRLEKDASGVRQQEVAVVAGPTWLQGRAAYVKVDQEAQGPEFSTAGEQLDIGFSAQPDPYWRIGARHRRDLDTGRSLLWSASTGYSDECLSIDFGIERDFASQADGGGSEDTVFIRVTFKHLGGIGISQGVASQSGDQP